jgi:hypothetical protein
MYLRESVEQKQIEFKYCPTADMLADMLTKGSISRVQFESLRNRAAIVKVGESVEESRHQDDIKTRSADKTRLTNSSGHALVADWPAWV